jgi:hypothetical protein
MAYHLAVGLSEAEADAKAARETRDYVIAELAQASSQIQKLNHIKASARAQALFWLFAGFIFSIAISFLIIARTALLPLESGSHAKAAVTVTGAPRPPGSDAANSTATAVHRGGSEISLPAGKPEALTRGGPPEARKSIAAATAKGS